MSGRRAIVSVIDIKSGKPIHNGLGLRETAEKLGMKYKTIVNGKNEGKPVKRRYRIIEAGACIPEDNSGIDNYALEWELKRYCEKLRQQIRPETLRRVRLHGVTKRGQIVR